MPRAVSSSGAGKSAGVRPGVASGVLVLPTASAARFRDPAHADAVLPPFPAYAEAPAWKPGLPATRVRPQFADRGGKRVVRVGVEPGTSLYGTGEQAGELIRNGTRKVMWTTDAFGYDDRSPSLYQAHPWVLGVRADGSAFGVLIETTWRMTMDLCAADPTAMTFTAEGPSPAVAILEGKTPQDVVKALAELTGKMAMPPLWALGYQQCRWSYEPADRVRELAHDFRERRIPCDVIWLDIDYMDRFRCFTFDPEKFAAPEKLMADLHNDGFKVVCMIDPGLAADPEYAVYKAGHAAGHFVEGRSHARVSSVVGDDTAKKWGLKWVTAPADAGQEYHGRVWPGACAFPDFTNAATRKWWAGLYKPYMAAGIDGVWNDMNEPAVFDGPGKTMPVDNEHKGDSELGGPGPHAKYHNLYGMQMVRASREGIVAANPTKRPFVLTRSNFLGGQRYAATWTGDNQAEWRHLRWSIPMVLNLGLSGQPFAGPDIGGFAQVSTPEMFAVWMGVGALLPFARGHKIKEWDGKPMPDHEPWSFGPRVEETCTRALVRRYRLLPYLYTLFEEASRTGMPVCRPLFFADPADPRLRGVSNAFLLGDDVLAVCPMDGPAELDASLPAMPRGSWREVDILADRVGAPGERDPWLPRLYIRGGAIIPLGPAMEHTGQKKMDPLTLLIAPDSRGEARGTLYDDAGEGLGYQKGEFRRTQFTARRDGAGVKVEPARVEGHWNVERKIETVVIEK